MIRVLGNHSHVTTTAPTHNTQLTHSLTLGHTSSTYSLRLPTQLYVQHHLCSYFLTQFGLCLWWTSNGANVNYSWINLIFNNLVSPGTILENQASPTFVHFGNSFPCEFNTLIVEIQNLIFKILMIINNRGVARNSETIVFVDCLVLVKTADKQIHHSSWKSIP